MRRRILHHYLGDLDVRGELVERLVADDRLNPAAIERAVRVTRVAGPIGREETERTLSHHIEERLETLGPARRKTTVDRGVARYDLTYVNASADVHAVVASLAANPRVAVCLHGPPGTGKTAFVHHVADQLGRPLYAHRASDILAPYLGQTEANLAKIFRGARAERVVLFLDEADSFLADRRRARQSWEVTQVNELLVRIEEFDGLLFCATNMIDQLDVASARRFSLSMRFDPLAREQRTALYRASIDALAPDGKAGTVADAVGVDLDAFDGLTPGDFAAATRQVRMLGGSEPGAELLDALRTRHREKRATGGGRLIGFGG